MQCLQQSTACACDAHLKFSSAAAVSRKRGSQPSAATACVNHCPQQRAKYSDFAGSSAKVVKWHGDDPADFTCTDMDGDFAEPLPTFFKD